MDPLRTSATVTEAIRSAIDSALEPGEQVMHLVPAIGCTLALTPRRLIVAREGSAFRPKTGVRHWDLDERLSVRVGLVRHGSGSLVIDRDREATSVFVDADHWDEALALVGAARAGIRRAEEAGE
jgi:hypothetical protein